MVRDLTQLNRLVCGVVCIALVSACAGAPKRTAPTDAHDRRSGKCRVTPGGRPAKEVAIALGNGPAYPVLGMTEAPPAPGGVAWLYENARHGTAYAVKTLWAVAPGAPPDMVVRGRSLRTGAPLTILVPAGAADARRGRIQDRVDHLTLPTQDGGWAYGVTTTLIPGPGCYAFRVVGGGVDEHLIFRAALAR